MFELPGSLHRMRLLGLPYQALFTALVLIFLTCACSSSVSLPAGETPIGSAVPQTAVSTLATPTSTTALQPQPTALSTAIPTSAPDLPVGSPLPQKPETEAPAETSAADVPSAPTLPSVCAALLPTPADMEGPYFLANSPQRSALFEPGMPGERLLLTGYVLTVDCKPLPGVRLEFWQADAAGAYDLQGYRLRGHQLSDELGRYTLDTVIPGLYEPRPRHIHVKLLPEGVPGLTTQLYFPGEGAPAAQTVEMVQPVGSGQAVFNFVLP